MLFHRIALSKDKSGVMELSKKGVDIEKAEDVIKDSYVFEFFGLSDKYSEKGLESAILNELNKNFSKLII